MAVGQVSDPSVMLETKLVDTIHVIPPVTGLATLVYDFSITNGITDGNYPRLSLVNSVDPLDKKFIIVQDNPDQPLAGTVSVYLTSGKTYILEAETCDCTSPNSIVGASYVSGTITYDHYIDVTDPKQWAPEMAGGLRIKEIKSFDANSVEPATVKTFVYGDIQVAGNIGVGYLVSPTIDTHTRNVYVVHPDVLASTETRFYVNSKSYIDWGYNGNSPVEYGKVTEYSGTPDNNVGKTEYRYTRTDPVMGFGGNEYFPYAYFLYPKYRSGRLSEKETFRKSGDNYFPVERTTYQYETKKSISVRAFKVLQKKNYLEVDHLADDSITFPERYIPKNYVIPLGNYKLISTRSEKIRIIFRIL